MAKKKTANKKPVNKKTSKKPVSNMPDKKIIIITAVCVAVIIGVIVFLAVRDKVNGNNEATTTSTTAVKATMSAQELERRALFDEHDALFKTVKEVYWLAVYDNYKSLMPPEAWVALAKEEGVTVEEFFALVEEDAKKAEPSEEEVSFYISGIAPFTGKECEEVVTRFANMYEMDVSLFKNAYILDVEMVFKSPDGTKTSENKIYYSFEVNGKRYLATETGFVG